MGDRSSDGGRILAAISSPANDGKEQDGSGVNMAGILQGLQASLSPLAKTSELHTETLHTEFERGSPPF